MMKLQTYTGLSLIATLAITYHAFNSKGQFYPAMVYLSTSKISLVLLFNMAFVIMWILRRLTIRVFLGSLREAEAEAERLSLREVVEIFFPITVFRQDFSITFLAMVTALMLIKALHLLAHKRVEYIETTPFVSVLSQVRIVSFICFLLHLDGLILYSSVKYLILSWQASFLLFFYFEFMLLATTTMSIYVKYIFYVSDMLMEGQWERKPVFTFYLELVRDLLHLSIYLCFILEIFMNRGIPVHLIGEFYGTFRKVKTRVTDYIRYCEITSNMNDRFADATPEELNASDATCIICREEMTTAKKLICRHLFHVHCLKSWLERQHTCPTCKALVVPTENGTTTSVGQQRSQSDVHQHGAGTGSSAQTEVGSGVACDNLSRHQARLQAATAAASLYEKSYFTPLQLLPYEMVQELFLESKDKGLISQTHSSPGYTLYPLVQKSVAESSSAELNGGQASSEQAQKQFVIPGGPMNVSFPPMQNLYFLPSQIHAAHMTYGEGFGNDPHMPNSQLGSQIKLQKEILQNQLQLLQKTNDDKSVDEDTSSSDHRDKHISTSSSLSHDEIQDIKA